MPTSYYAHPPFAMLRSCDLGGTNNFSCPIPVETPLQCRSTGSDSQSLTQICPTLDGNSSGAVVPSEPSSGAVPLWVFLPLGLLLVVVLRILCRMSRDRSNLRLSRDRANLDLQLITHQMQRGQTQPNDLASQADSQSERRYSSLAGATVASLPPGPPSSSAASVTGVAAASPPPDPTSNSNGKGKGKGKRKAEAGTAEVFPSWAELDRQFYETAAGKTYLTAAATSTSAACTSSEVQASGFEALHSSNTAIKRPFAGSELAVPQLAEVSPAHLVAIGLSPAPPSTVLPKRPAPPAPLARKAVPRKFTAEGVEIHHLLHPLLHTAAPALDDRWNAHWRARDARDAAAPPERPATHAPAPTPAPAIDQSVDPLELWAETDPQCHAENPEASSDLVRLADLAELTELQDAEAVVALSNHLGDRATEPRNPYTWRQGLI